MKLILIVGLALLLAACTRAHLSIDDAAFGQERMAHSASIGTMYLDSTTRDGTHNCDDSPTTCCASGYHLCTLNELKAGGREIEDSGTGRDATTYGIWGWVDTLQDSGTDCTGYSSTSNLGTQCSISATIACQSSLGEACSGTDQVWCCSS